MKLRSKTKSIRDIDLNITAMIDVILLLLIFFMCTHSFNEPEKNIESQTIAKGLSKNINIDELEPIEISAQFDGEVNSYLCSGNIFTDLSELRSFLSTLYAIADTKVIISGRDDVRFQVMIDALNVCKGIGFSNVGFATGAVQ